MASEIDQTETVGEALLLEHVQQQARDARGYNQDIARYILEHGRFYKYQRYDPSVYGRKAKDKSCFRNAAILAGQHKLLYVEGICAGSQGEYVPHAFCVDDNGFVVDQTWTHGLLCVYYGVPLNGPKVLSYHMARGRHVSMLDDFERGWPLINGRLDGMGFTVI